jgi:hypothetical protein
VSNGRVGERLETRLRETAQGGYARKRLRLRAYFDRGSQSAARQVMRPQARWSIAT